MLCLIVHEILTINLITLNLFTLSNAQPKTAGYFWRFDDSIQVRWNEHFMIMMSMDMYEQYYERIHLYVCLDAPCYSCMGYLAYFCRYPVQSRLYNHRRSTQVLFWIALFLLSNQCYDMIHMIYALAWLTVLHCLWLPGYFPISTFNWTRLILNSFNQMSSFLRMDNIRPY